MLVAIPTAMPRVPFRSSAGTAEGRTIGSLRVWSYKDNYDEKEQSTYNHKQRNHKIGYVDCYTSTKRKNHRQNYVRQQEPYTE